MKPLVRTYLLLERLLPAFLFVSIILVMLMEITSRLVLRKSFEWNTEFCRYALVWVTFFGCIYVQRDNTHIRVSVLYDILRQNGYRRMVFLFDLLHSLFALGFWWFLVFYGYRFCLRVTNFTSSAMDISQYWLYICTCVCGVLCGVMELGRLGKLVLAAVTGRRADTASEGD